ncbi:Uncharacterized protein QTN25_010531 [Entamoeba marina]
MIYYHVMKPFWICISFISLCYATMELSFMLLAAPKIRPELDITMFGLLNAFNNANDQCKLNLFVLKGCDCSFPRLDEFVELFRKELPFVNVDIFNISSKNETLQYNFNFVDEMFHAIDHKHKRPDWYTPAKLKKHYIINFYFHSLAKYVYTTTQTDLFIFLEDDMTFDPEMINKILNEYNQHDFDEFCTEKITPYTYSQKPNQPNIPYDSKQWGYYGLMKTRRQLEQFFRYMKFSRYYESGDHLSGEFCKVLKKNFFTMNLSRHFGKDKTLPKQFSSIT